ncbi:MAG: hypothetical protein ACREUU_14520 [Gammaproteobacteria bacterium]
MDRQDSMKAVCPKCRGAIPLDDVNVATDIAVCRRCEQTFDYSELIEVQEAGPVDPNRPPKGAWYKRTPGGFEVGSTTRSPIAFFLVPFMGVWAGGSLGGIYGTQIAKGKFDLGQSLFGIPFLLGTLLFGSIALMAACGKVVVRLDGKSGEVFTGVGPVGWRRRFQKDDVTGVRRTEHRGNKGQVSDQITIEGRHPIRFALGLPAERLNFILGTLRQGLGK